LAMEVSQQQDRHQKLGEVNGCMHGVKEQSAV
jgi:hypothetical protein